MSLTSLVLLGSAFAQSFSLSSPTLTTTSPTLSTSLTSPTLTTATTSLDPTVSLSTEMQASILAIESHDGDLHAFAAISGELDPDALLSATDILVFDADELDELAHELADVSWEDARIGDAIGVGIVGRDDRGRQWGRGMRFTLLSKDALVRQDGHNTDVIDGYNRDSPLTSILNEIVWNWVDNGADGIPEDDGMWGARGLTGGLVMATGGIVAFAWDRLLTIDFLTNRTHPLNRSLDNALEEAFDNNATGEIEPPEEEEPHKETSGDGLVCEEAICEEPPPKEEEKPPEEEQTCTTKDEDGKCASHNEVDDTEPPPKEDPNDGYTPAHDDPDAGPCEGELCAVDGDASGDDGVADPAETFSSSDAGEAGTTFMDADDLWTDPADLEYAGEGMAEFLWYLGDIPWTDPVGL